MVSLTQRPAAPIRAPRGTALSCKGWPQEAALRMLMNNLDPDVAERWEDLVVYGGSGKAARSWEAYHRIIASLRSLESDETLLVQSGKPVGIFRTHLDAPRVLIAIAMNDGVGLFVEIDRERIERRLRLHYVDRATDSLDEALRWAQEARTKGETLSIALHGNAAETHPEIARREIRPDVVTDQTSAHDMLIGYIPVGLEPSQTAALRQRDPEEYTRRAYESLARHMRAMIELQGQGAVLFDYGNNIRREAENAGVHD